jgi:D-glycero-D-manno-heptose 1,7-bisphosphate phosphatase
MGVDSLNPSRSSRRAVFLDRDGVVNEAVMKNGRPYPPLAAADVVIVADAPSALGSLKSRGLPLIVVTNQPDVARGAQTAEAIAAIHARLLRELPIDDVLSCFHDDGDACSCRKPLPGLILEGALRYGVDPLRSFMIGDRWRDIDAGAAAGCATILINREYDDRPPEHQPDYHVRTLSEAADAILNSGRRSPPAR